MKQFVATSLVLLLVTACGEDGRTAKETVKSSAPGCFKDTDCKFDRICDAGVCVNPKTMPVKSAKSDKPQPRHQAPRQSNRKYTTAMIRVNSYDRSEDSKFIGQFEKMNLASNCKKTGVEELIVEEKLFIEIRCEAH